jgi:hypothetical protein
MIKNKKYQRNPIHMTFTLRIPIMNFEPNLILRDRNNDKKEFEESQEFHQVPDHPSTFMKIFKGKRYTISATYYERCQVLSSKVIWDGTIDRFEVF